MVAVISLIAFGGALSAALAVIFTSVAPQWQRIFSLASGHVETSFAPLAQLASAEQRIAIRRWASAPAPGSFRQLREVA